MSKIFKTVSIILCIVIMLGIAPLNGFVGLELPKLSLPKFNLSKFSELFVTKAEAEGSTFYTSGYCGKKTDEYPNGENISWLIDTDTGLLTVTGTGEIASNAFDNDLRIVNATLSEGITAIGYQAFSDCDNMVSIVVPESVVTVGSQAFYDCDALIEISLPSVTAINYETLQGCNNLQSVSIPEATVIENFGIYACHKLTNIYMPKVEVMYQHAIAYCACTTLDMPSIKILGWSSCANTNVECLVLPDSLISLTGGTFQGSKQLTEVYIGKGLVTFENVFANCDNLAQINISPENENYCSVDGIMYDKQKTEFVLVPPAITGTITIPASITDFSVSSMIMCKSLQAVLVESNNPIYSSEDGILYNKDKSAVVFCPRGKTGSITLNENTTTVKSCAFEYCKLNNIIMPSVKTVEESAFYQAGSVSSVVMPCIETIKENGFWGISITSFESSTIKEIGPWAFQECPLTEVILHDSLITLSGRAFNDCRNLTEVQIGSGMESITNTTFNGCTALKDFTVSDNNPNYCTIDNVLYNKSQTKVVFIPSGIEGVINVPASVTEFPLTRDLTNGWYSLTAVNINQSNSVYSSEDGIVYNKDKTKLLFCPNGKDGIIYVNENTTIIGKQAFDKCRNITEVYMPNVTELEYGAFGQCSALVKVDMPKVITLDMDSFLYCRALTEMNMPNAKKLGDDALKGCGFFEFTYPEGIQTFKEYDWWNISILSLPNKYAKYIDNRVLTHSRSGCTIRAYCGSPGHILATKQMLNFESIGHTWLDWYTVTPATYESEGVERRDCAYCDGYEERTIPTLKRETYTVTFTADGNVVATVDYPKGATEIEEPPVPAKDRYIGEWEEYELSDSDLTVNAIYTLIKSDDASEIETDSDVVHYTYDDDVLFRISASSNAKVVKSIVSQSIPLDIVLVVDQSGSMDDPLGGSTKKVDALKSTATEFVNTVYENARQTGAEHRISIVGFGLSGTYQGYDKNENSELLTSANGVVNYGNIRPSDYASSLLSVNINGAVNSNLLAAVNSIDARGATAADLGLEMAKGVFANTDSEGRQRIVIFMTDGEPTYQSDFQSAVANAAIANAKVLKSEYSATVYSLGIYNSSYINNNNIKNFMKSVSSNYPNAVSMKYMGNKVSDDFYLTVSDTSALSGVFRSITKEALSHTAPFDNLTLIKTLSDKVTLTSQQEEKLRTDVIREYGITNDDIIITRKTNGTTEIKINNLKPKETVEDDGSVKYKIYIEFFASFNENAASAGTYTVDTEDSGIMLSPDASGYEATFSTSTITTESSKAKVIFTINGEIYEISEFSNGGTITAPDFEFSPDWSWSGWLVQSLTASNGLVVDATLTKADRTAIWHTATGSITQTYKPGDFIIAPETEIETIRGTFLSWNRSIPTTMPDESLEFTAVYGGHVHHYTSEITTPMTCIEDGVRTYTCVCGDTYTEVISACGHEFEAITPSTDKDDGKCTLVCKNCGQRYDYALDYQIMESYGWRTRILYEFQLTDDNLETGFEPDGSIYVKIPLSDSQNLARSITVIRTNEDGSKTAVPARIEHGFLIITADHFTPYQISFDIDCASNGGHIDENEDNTCDLCESKILAESIVTFFVDGTVYSSETYIEGENIITPSNPSKDGYLFSGWTPSVPETVGTTDLTFIATWEAPEHTHIGFVAGANVATCTQSGYTGTTYCSDCGEIISEGETIPATGHSYTNWSNWSKSENEKTRYRVCTECGYKEVQTAPLWISGGKHFTLDQLIDYIFYKIFKPIFALFRYEYRSKYNWD